MSAPRTIKVRIAVQADADGRWECDGSSARTDKRSAAMAHEFMEANGRTGPMRLVFVEAEIPLPDPATATTVRGVTVKGGA